MEIHSDISNEEIIKALEGDITTLWSLISTLDGDEEFNKIKNKIENGIKLGFNIEVVVRGYVQEYPDSGNVKVRGYKKMPLYEYWKELRLREKMMKDILREEYDEGEQAIR